MADEGLLFGRNLEFHADLELVRIAADHIFVRVVDTPPLRRIAVGLVGDRQRCTSTQKGGGEEELTQGSQEVIDQEVIDQAGVDQESTGKEDQESVRQEVLSEKEKGAHKEEACHKKETSDVGQDQARDSGLRIIGLNLRMPMSTGKSGFRC